MRRSLSLVLLVLVGLSASACSIKHGNPSDPSPSQMQPTYFPS
jgi:hypothetical protein